MIARNLTLSFDIHGGGMDFIFPHRFSSKLCSLLQQQHQLKDKALGGVGLTEENVFSLIEERVQARKNKKYVKSNQIMLDLKAKGVALMDLGKETIWRPCVPAEPEQPVQRQQPAATAISTQVQPDQPMKPTSTPAKQSQPVAPVSKPVPEEQPVAPVSTSVREEQTVAASTPVLENQIVGPVPTTIREKQPLAPFST